MSVSARAARKEERSHRLGVGERGLGLDLQRIQGQKQEVGWRLGRRERGWTVQKISKVEQGLSAKWGQEQPRKGILAAI